MAKKLPQSRPEEPKKPEELKTELRDPASFVTLFNLGLKFEELQTFFEGNRMSNVLLILYVNYLCIYISSIISIIWDG